MRVVLDVVFMILQTLYQLGSGDALWDGRHMSQGAGGVEPSYGQSVSEYSAIRVTIILQDIFKFTVQLECLFAEILYEVGNNDAS